jgi:hypothetical protein
MAGERLAKLTLRVENLVANDPILTPPFITPWTALRLRLGGTWVRFTPSARSFRTVGAEDNYEYPLFAINGTELPAGVDMLLATIRRAILDHGWSYTVSAKRTAGQAPTGYDYWAFDVEATVYDRTNDLAWNLAGTQPIVRPTFLEVASLTTIRPVRAQVLVTDALIFASPTGAVEVVASNGNDGVYSYFWADFGAPATALRTNIPNGVYTCTVTDTSGASVVVQALVGSDPRLEVRVERNENDVTLVPSGGLAPYAYQWGDGPTTAVRLALTSGVYTAVVTDARGATRAVSVTIDSYRYYWSKNPVTLSLDAGPAYRLDPTTKPNLSFLCEVWVEETYLSGVFVRLGGTQEQPADAQGRTVFDAQALLDGYLQEHLPDLNQAVPSRADSLFRRFYFRYAEKFGVPAVAAALSSQVRHYVVLGGLDFYESSAAGLARWLAYQARIKPFLTWEPNNKKLLATQPEYLYYMVDSLAVTSFQVWARVSYADGRVAERLVATVPGVHRFEVYCLPAGYQQLALAPPLPGDPAVVAWEVWVSDEQGVAQTERRRYLLTTDYVARPRYFLYTTSLGGTATLACTGDAKIALEVKVEEADRPLGVGYDPLLGDTLVLDRAGTPTLSVATGKLRPAQLVTLQDFLLSRRVTLQADDAYFAGRVKAKSVTFRDESPVERVAEFDYLLPAQRQFTPRLPSGSVLMPVAGGEGPQP